MMAGDPHAQAVRGLRPVLRQISDVSGDSAFLICRAGNDSLCLHREVGNYPVQVLAVTVGIASRWAWARPGWRCWRRCRRTKPRK